MRANVLFDISLTVGRYACCVYIGIHTTCFFYKPTVIWRIAVVGAAGPYLLSSWW